MQRIFASFLATALLLAGFSCASAQSLFSFTFTNVTNINSGDDLFITVNLRWNGTASSIPNVPNPLFGSLPSGGNYGVAGAGVAIRISTGSTGSVVVSSTPAVTTDVLLAPGFSSTTLSVLDTQYLDLLDPVPGYNNLLGAAFGTGTSSGVTAPVSSTSFDLPLVSFRITGASGGSVTLQANLDDLLSSPSNFVYGTPAFGQPFADLIDPGTVTFNVISAVPEPATWAMMIFSIAAGIGSVVYYRRQRLSQANHQLATLEEATTE